MPDVDPLCMALTVVDDHDEDTVHVLVETYAPEPTVVTRRLPVTLVVALDVSASMDQDAPIDGAKDALTRALNQLQARDRFGLIAFGDEARVVVPVGEIRGRLPQIRAAITNLTPDGRTNLSAGLHRALNQARHGAAGTGARVLVISGGHPDGGIPDAQQLEALAREARLDGITTTCVGYGPNWDDQLLGFIADGGGGELLSAPSPVIVADHAGDTVRGLLTTTVHRAALVLRWRPGYGPHFSAPAELHPRELVNGGVRFELGDYAAGQARRSVLLLPVPGLAELGPVEVAELHLEYLALPSLERHLSVTSITANLASSYARTEEQ